MRPEDLEPRIETAEFLGAPGVRLHIMKHPDDKYSPSRTATVDDVTHAIYDTIYAHHRDTARRPVAVVVPFGWFAIFVALAESTRQVLRDPRRPYPDIMIESRHGWIEFDDLPLIFAMVDEPAAVPHEMVALPDGQVSTLPTAPRLY